MLIPDMAEPLGTCNILETSSIWNNRHLLYPDDCYSIKKGEFVFEKCRNHISIRLVFGDYELHASKNISKPSVFNDFFIKSQDELVVVGKNIKSSIHSFMLQNTDDCYTFYQYRANGFFKEPLRIKVSGDAIKNIMDGKFDHLLDFGINVRSRPLLYSDIQDITYQKLNNQLIYSLKNPSPFRCLHSFLINDSFIGIFWDDENDQNGVEFAASIDIYVNTSYDWLQCPSFPSPILPTGAFSCQKYGFAHFCRILGGYFVLRDHSRDYSEDYCIMTYCFDFVTPDDTVYNFYGEKEIGHSRGYEGACIFTTFIIKRKNDGYVVVDVKRAFTTISDAVSQKNDDIYNIYQWVDDRENMENTKDIKTLLYDDKKTKMKEIICYYYNACIYFKATVCLASADKEAAGYKPPEEVAKFTTREGMLQLAKKYRESSAK